MLWAEAALPFAMALCPRRWPSDFFLAALSHQKQLVWLLGWRQKQVQQIHVAMAAEVQCDNSTTQE